MTEARYRPICFLAATTCIAALMTPGTAQAAESAAPEEQAAPPLDSAAGNDDIVVTARRRDETLQAVPVTVTAVTAATLAARGVNNLEGFARIVPQLFLATSSGSVQGGAIGLRGVSASDGNVFGDQAVAFNIDGVQIARATPRQLSSFDLEQIQALKGPQALYFGKNSPGGIVAIRTADPTDRLEAGAIASYEFNARELRGEGFLSGPIAGGLSGRVAVVASTMRGWVTNVGTPGTPYSISSHRHLPKSDEFGGRLTLKFDDGGPLTARLKFNYGRLDTDGNFSNAQRIFCPLGTAQLGGPDDCTPDDRANHTALGTRLGTGGANTVTGAIIPGVYVFGDGQPFARTAQYLAGLEVSYKLADTLSLASTTGYYDARIELADNANSADALFAFNPAAPAAASGILATYQDLEIREISQELRLTSDFAGPINFMIGGYYQDQKLSDLTTLAVNGLNPIQLFPPETLKQDGVAYSFFGSVSFKPVEGVELSGGARYSHEKKEFSVFRLLNGTLPASQGGAAYVPGQQVPTLVPSRSFNNVSPEATITWRPNERLTAYASWKRGFLSGGFNGSGTGTNVAVIGDFSYDQEIVQGFEAGFKATAFDRSLRFSFAAYDYDIKGLQVSSTLPGPPPVQIASNAASATSRGAEADLNWRTPAKGFSVRGSVAYNRARYKSFTTSPCYGGQTVALGCNGGFNGTVFTNQNLSGRPLVRSPNWGGSVGASYELNTAGGGLFGISTDANYLGGFFTDAPNSPGGYQKSYWLLDASARYKLPSGLELALIGRNLTNEYYFQRSGAATFTGGPSGVATSTLPDQLAYVSRGREIRIQATFRFR